MYQQCPKCGYINSANVEAAVCPKCGLIFDKWLKNKYKSETVTDIHPKSMLVVSLQQLVNKYILYVPDIFSKSRFYLNLIIYVLFFIWGWSFILADHYSAELNNSFMHLINLVFHEAGHVIFRLLGNFMVILGGSLLQLLVPMIFLFSFLSRKESFAASIMLWWFAQSMMDLVAYIDDARRQEMWLLGGVQGKDMPGIHDWNNILNISGLMGYEHTIAVITSWVAILLMLLSFYWGAVLLRKMLFSRCH